MPETSQPQENWMKEAADGAGRLMNQGDRLNTIRELEEREGVVTHTRGLGDQLNQAAQKALKAAENANKAPEISNENKEAIGRTAARDILKAMRALSEQNGGKLDKNDTNVISAEVMLGMDHGDLADLDFTDAGDVEDVVTGIPANKLQELYAASQKDKAGLLKGSSEVNRFIAALGITPKTAPENPDSNEPVVARK